MGLAWWQAPVMTALWEVEAGASQIQVQPGRFSGLARLSRNEMNEVKWKK